MIKQVIVIRKDLKMRRGKEIAQACHAAIKAVFLALNNLNEYSWSIENDEIALSAKDSTIAEWFNSSYTKVCLQVNSEKELLDLKEQADNLGLACALIQDNGVTEFHNVPTYTCLAFEPLPSETIDMLTGELKLY